MHQVHYCNCADLQPWRTTLAWFLTRGPLAFLVHAPHRYLRARVPDCSGVRAPLQVGLRCRGRGCAGQTVQRPLQYGQEAGDGLMAWRDTSPSLSPFPCFFSCTAIKQSRYQSFTATSRGACLILPNRRHELRYDAEPWRTNARCRGRYTSLCRTQT